MPQTDNTMRLQRFLARAGVDSRRKCEQLIADGRVRVNGQVVSEPGCKVDSARDVVEFDGQRIKLPNETFTCMLNKPCGYLTTVSDDRGRKTVMELVPADVHAGLFPVGRLDADTSGLLLFTTDGELAQALLHPAKHVNKTYVAQVEGRLSDADVQALEAGVMLDDGMTHPAQCHIVRFITSKNKSFKSAKSAKRKNIAQSVEGGLAQDGAARPKTGSRVKSSAHDINVQTVAELTIHEGRKRQVRRMFAAIGHPVVKLNRKSIGALELGDLKVGEWRELGPKDFELLGIQNA
jgi:23S rRNA pseudouridine2605 synthase